jgi:signal transduction histidine kinase
LSYVSRIPLLRFRQRSLWRKSPYSPEEIRRTERWLATARLFLAISALMAVWMDPAQVRSEWAYALLAFYIAHGTAVMFLLRSPQQPTPAFRFLVHAADVVWPALISLFTTGQSSPFFLFFLFVLAAAANRWGLWETVITSVASIWLLWLESLLLVEGVVRSLNVWSVQHRLPTIQADALDFEPKRLFMRSVYLVVMGLLLGYLAERQKKLRAEKGTAAKMLGLVRMDLGLTGTLSQIVSEVLDLYGAKRALIAARESGSSRVSIGVLQKENGIPELRWLDPGTSSSEMYLAESPATSWFASNHRTGNGFRITGMNSAGARLRDLDPTVVRGLAGVQTFKSLAAVSFSFGQELSGRIFLVEPNFAAAPEEELLFLQNLARQISPAIYNVYLLRRLRRRAGALERARLVRELHDGAVQSLIGVEMQVDVLRRQYHGAEFIAAELDRIQKLLREEVLKLRELMQQMKSAEVDARKLPGFLRDTVQRFQRETGIIARFIMDGEEVALSQSVCRELARIAQEALVNVRKHSGAKQVLVELLQEQGRWELIVEDNGTGFPFSGRMSQHDLDSNGQSPAIIRERVRLIQGELTIESKPGRGSRIEVRVSQEQQVES